MKNYIIGFVLSILLTVEAYLLVVNDVFKGTVLIAAIVALAIIQLLIQLVFFLHMDSEPRPRWNLHVMMSAVVVVVIVVFGSLWIMGHLDYHHGPPEGDIDTYIQNEENIYRDY